MKKLEFHLTTPPSCIAHAMSFAAATTEPFTLRDAKRLCPVRHPHEDWLDAVHQYVTEGLLRTLETPPGKVGRPTTYFYPTKIPRLYVEERDRFVLVMYTGSDSPAPRPTTRDLIETTGRKREESAPPSEPPEPPSVSPDTEPLSEPEAEPEPEVCEYCNLKLEYGPMGPFCPDEDCTSNTEPELQEPEPEPQEPEPESEPEPETLPASDPDISDDRERAYAYMRSLIAKSVNQREGAGCTFDELMWILVKKGFSESEAETYAKDLAGHHPDAYKEGGLRLEGPFSVRNKTEQPRYYLRTPAQVLDDNMAEFEAMKVRNRKS